MQKGSTCHKAYFTKQLLNYFCQGGYAIVVICLFVFFSVSNFVQKLPNGFA